MTISHFLDEGALSFIFEGYWENTNYHVPNSKDNSDFLSIWLQTFLVCVCEIVFLAL